MVKENHFDLAEALSYVTSNPADALQLKHKGRLQEGMDADIVLLLFREDYYAREDAEERNVANCDVAKNRHGAVGVVKLGWDNRYTRFTNLELGRDEP